MKVRWLGWAGVEIESSGESVVIDPLGDAAATFAALGDAASGVELPSVVPASGAAVAGLVTHLHRDHTDAAALAAALAADASVHEPARTLRPEIEELAVAQADAELGRAGLSRRAVEPWTEFEVGPFALTALPAVDGLGDPQVSWLVEADGCKILHLGDTLFHASWWAIARRCGPVDVVFVPINGAVVNFPHLQPPSPLSAVMEPEQAAAAAQLLGARTAIPMHYGAYEIAPWYAPIGDAAERFTDAAADRPYDVRMLEPGESLELEAAHV